MQFTFQLPTKVFFGCGCIEQNKEEFARWGTRALIVTGRKSARISGALADVTAVLDSQGVAWELFDRIEENPTVEAMEEAGAAARKFAPSVIVAIGGGSPLDAAKAIAVLAVNDIPGHRLFDGSFAAPPVPVLAVPLTAGTGSEVTPYSILTDAGRQTKRSFSDPRIFPRAAFLDARYTQSLSRDVTVNTAVDALSHAVEGYLSKRSTVMSDCLAVEAMRQFGKARKSLEAGSFSLEDREALLYCSLLAGVVIAQTGTTAVHALGYSLTYFRNVPHGRANGLLLGEYLRFTEPGAAEKTAVVLETTGLGTVAGCREWMQAVLTNQECYTEKEICDFASMAAQTKNMVNTPRDPAVDDLRRILSASLRVTGQN